MAYNKEKVSTIHDDPCEGKPFEFPQCTSCVHCDGSFCRKFNKERLELIVDKITDVFNCESFESKY